MANSLLDFVMSLVRDPAAAAAYTADPTQAIADANLTDVTSADVSNLIPVVSESLSMGTPVTGTEALDGNVWSSGAATSAFDAFDAELPERVLELDSLDASFGPTISDDLDLPDSALSPQAQEDLVDLVIDPVVDDAAAVDPGLVLDDPAGLEQSLDELGDSLEPGAEAAGFDIFD